MIGLGLGITGRMPRTYIPSPISASIRPVMSALQDGQVAADVTGYGAMTDIANYVSAAGSIASVVTTVTGEAIDADTPLSAGNTVGFIVTVTDSAGNTRVFSAGVTSVRAIATDAAIAVSGSIVTFTSAPVVAGTAVSNF